MKRSLTLGHCLAFIVLTLSSACGQRTAVLPTETPPPTLVPPTSVATSTLTPVTITPSPLPTELVFPLITPDPIQVERWNEYETALAQAFFHSFFQPEEVVCEWQILGRAGSEVYVWARCAGVYSAIPSQGSIPTVIHLRSDGSVEKAEIPGAGSLYAPDIRRMFPPDVQEVIFNRSIFSRELWDRMEDRLRWRRGHRDEPPWIILNSLSAQPTQAAIPLITPDSIQVERWMEYQTALAIAFSYLPPEQEICEWELLGRSVKEVYVWAICGEVGGAGSLEGLAVLYLREDGSIQTQPFDRIDFPDEIRKRFPLEVQERYFGGLVHFQELVDHLRWRKMHPGEPPWIVVGATPTP